MPKISVIIGVYNAKEKNIIEKSINSILNQTYKDIEIIICDDGSTDNTLQYIKEITEKDERVKVMSNKSNMGLAYTLNKCIKEAKGKYIARMDIDDYSESNRLEKQIMFLEENNEYSVVGCNALLFDKNGTWGKRNKPEYIKKEHFLFNNPIMHPTVMVRKKDIEEVSGYDEDRKKLLLEDYDLWMRMFKKGFKMYNIQEYLYNYRENKNTFYKKEYSYRIREAKVRYYGYKNLKLLPKGYIYILKPLILGLFPSNFLFYIHRRVENIKKV